MEKQEKGRSRMRRIFSIFFHRKLKRRQYLERLGLISAFVLFMTLMLSQTYRPIFQYEVGQPWQDRTLNAPFDFSIYKHPDTLSREQDRVLEQVIPIFVRDTSQIVLVRASLVQEAKILFENNRRYEEAGQNEDTLILNHLDREYYLPRFEKRGESVLEKFPFSNSEQVSATLIRLADEIFEKGYIDAYWQDTVGFLSLRTSPTEESLVSVYTFFSDSTLASWTEDQLKTLRPEALYLLQRILLQEVSPNILYNEELTQMERERMLSHILLTRGKVSKGELIIAKGEYVDSETDQTLQSLQRELQKRVGSRDIWAVFLGEALVILLITGVLLIYLYIHRTQIYKDNKRLSLIFTLFLLTVGSLVLTSKITAFALQVTNTMGSDLNLSYLYLAPASILAIFISNFFDHRTGFISNILLALFGATLVQQALEYAFVQIIAGTVAVYSLRQIRQRKTIFYSLAYTLLAYVIAYLAFSFFSKSEVHSINYRNLVLFVINVALTLLLFNFIYLIERVFKLTSDLTYLELLDTNHPLMLKLARKAPGTFQHSLHVASLAEVAVNAINGNALLVHVGALFHDIGKMKHPSYFIENGGSDKQNPHDELPFKESAEIIIDHVNQGVELANQYKLPPEIIEFILTHHGTTRVEYFYRKFLKENGCSDDSEENCFRYKGPLPESRETAVLMIADSIEAASRGISSPSPQAFRDLINHIIDYKINDGQLDNSKLTFKDISTIRDVLYKQLLSMNHARIEYPKEVDAVAS